MTRRQTLFLLMSEFEGKAAVELSDCYHYLGYTSAIAAQRDAAVNRLGVPVYRGKSSQKSPRMVWLEDLAAYIDKVRAEADQAARGSKAGK